MTSHSCIYSLTNSREYLLCMCLPATPMRAVYKGTSTLCKVIIRHRQNVAIKACGCVYTRLQCDCTVPVHNTTIEFNVQYAYHSAHADAVLHCIVCGMCDRYACYHGVIVTMVTTVYQCSLPHACRSRATYHQSHNPITCLLCVSGEAVWLDYMDYKY